MDEELIVDLYINEGLSGPKIAKKVGVGTSTVYRVLNRHGHRDKTRNAGRLFSAAREEQIRDEYLTGATLEDLADWYGCGQEGIANAIRRQGGELRPVGPSTSIFQHTEEVLRLNEENPNMSQREIGEKVGIGQASVSIILRKAGVARRTPLRNNGRSVKEGYVLVRCDPDDPISREMANAGGYVLEHRLAMARSLGRPLRKGETVHHINGDKMDNRLKNLQLRQGQHGRGVVSSCGDCGSTNIVSGPIAEVTAA